MSAVRLPFRFENFHIFFERRAKTLSICLPQSLRTLAVTKLEIIFARTTLEVGYRRINFGEIGLGSLYVSRIFKRKTGVCCHAGASAFVMYSLKNDGGTQVIYNGHYLNII